MQTKNIAFIPVRGGSKSIPLKNIKLLNGEPLIYWTAKAACECNYICKVYIATDSDVIKNTVMNFNLEKVEVIGRSVDNSSDNATTESVMLEFADNYDFDNIVLIQATSPLLTADDLNRGFAAFEEVNTDSVLSAVRQKRFNWAMSESGFASAINYDVFSRPRRQNFEGYLVENGAFYITRKKDLLKYKNRISGNIKIIEMDEDTYFEIDEPSDWTIVENLMKDRDSKKKLGIFEIKLFLTDCDGCLTDSSMYYSENGDELKKFNARDGMSFQLLRECGIYRGIITRENIELIGRRAKKLQVDILKTGIKDKASEVKKVCENYNISFDNVAYIGDDLNDYGAMSICGFKACPANAVKEIREICDYISPYDGGCGAVRDIVEYILKKQNKWFDILKKFKNNEK